MPVLQQSPWTAPMYCTCYRRSMSFYSSPLAVALPMGDADGGTLENTFPSPLLEKGPGSDFTVLIQAHYCLQGRFSC